MSIGVKVVGTAEPLDPPGAPSPGSSAEAGIPAPPAAVAAEVPAQPRTKRRRWPVVGLAVLAALGLAGTAGFGIAWAGLHARQSGEAQARATAKTFLVDLTNFDAKTVDKDFGAITSMATGTFGSQAQKFFNSSIRQELQKALASSRGQIRDLYVQSYGTQKATVYGVVDQLYVNAKLSSPQTDVLRLVVTLDQIGSAWKVADVSVLQGPSPVSGSK